MKKLYIAALFSMAALTSCDPQSTITKKSVEKYQPTPTQSVSPAPTEEPIDPADIITVDTSLAGDTISIDGPKQRKNAACTKFNRVMVNNNDNEVKITGACRQIMINGSGNNVTAEATAEIVINGSENNITYTRIANGKRPVVKENRGGNTVEKVAAAAK